MDSKEIMQALVSIHNRLCDVQVKGDNALPLSDCIRGLRQLIDNMSQTQAPTELAE